MPLKKDDIMRILYPEKETVRARRFTQDSPVLPDVWSYFGEQPGRGQKLLLTPASSSSVQALVNAVRERLERDGARLPDVHLLYNQSHVLAELTFRQLMRVALPLSPWWQKYIAREGDDWAEALRTLARHEKLAEVLIEPARREAAGPYNEDCLQLARIAGAVALGEAPPDDLKDPQYWRRALEALAGALEGMAPVEHPEAPLWSVNCNRTARNAIWRSRQAVKADAAARLFKISCQGIRWAIIDSGVDAGHQAFAARPARKNGTAPEKSSGAFSSRVLKTYDFRRLSAILDPYGPPEELEKQLARSGLDAMDPATRANLQSDLRRRLTTGQVVDWNLIEPFLAMPHGPQYERPVNEHGTHVAGILGADWDNGDYTGEKALIGMCPDIELYDFRVFDEDGKCDEFTILGALQFVRHLNLNKDQMVVHGVNLSMSLIHDVRNFACGRTPVCEEVERLVGSGVVVVASAGNEGFHEGYNPISITDPGNAESVITVGATHRFMPHTYGVSYFSSRGPTGDGRMKPDLVAPGEKIKSVTPGDQCATLDGTSMAAPHVSGGAALLMARYRELIGQPRRIKQILCSTATDLGRERAFQGAGMLDVLRALQSV